MLEFGPETNDCIDYNTAWLYCITCTHDNHYDWRLPTRKEYHKSPIIMSWFNCDNIRSYEKGGFVRVTPVRDIDD